ncbi:MAG: hypothetical protein WCS37_01690 [Chloroflexota bacterium]|nr:hypothetical protein [Chloroflexota bacterium]
MLEDNQDNISSTAYPILREVLEAERLAVGLSVEELLQEVTSFIDAELELADAYQRFVAGERSALLWQEAFLIALVLNVGPRDLLLSFPSAFDMGGKAYIIIYQLDPTKSKNEIWQDFLVLWHES